MQEDCCHSTLTVRETLWFVCALRLGPDIGRHERLELIDATMEDVGLSRESGQLVNELMTRVLSLTRTLTSRTSPTRGSATTCLEACRADSAAASPLQSSSSLAPRR